jgi:proteasome lid subunit RPN8/RPN11
VLREIAAHARDAWPNECCGLLIGGAHTIEAAHRARNLHDSPVRYLVQPEDHFAAIRRARARGLEVVGAYHSHPAGRPGPSPVDRAEAQPSQFIHVIAGTRRFRRRRRDLAMGRPGRRLAKASPNRGRTGPCGPRRRSTGTSSLWMDGQWMAAWRLVQGNFVQVPLVRDT